MARKHEPSRATELVQEAIDKTGQATAQVEGLLRDLPEPKEEPEPFTFTSGVPQLCYVRHVGPRGTATYLFTIEASASGGGAEVRVIGASNVTIG